ncbi:MAG: hypothetical protein PF495_16590 [Spirochaetales bacterium]|jgi:hypothetical protein|nr:hypothetical protein [Spirochaetales bacterium]
MNRKEALKSSWVSISVRLPPDKESRIETWNYVKQMTIVMDSFIARLAAEKLLKLKEAVLINEGLSWDRRISH